MRILLVTLLLFANYAYAQLPKMENGKMALDKPVTFKTGIAELTEEAKEGLKPVKEFLSKKDYISTLGWKGIRIIQIQNQ